MNDEGNETELHRRDVLRATGLAMIGGVAASTAAANDANTGPLGARLQGVQHFGLTVQNMDRACAFYTEVLGGTEVVFNKFIADLEAEAARRGMTQVRANRVVTVTTEQERLAAPREANSNGITEGRSTGWRLIYCKGPEGEQLEFVQALGPVKAILDSAREARRSPAGGR